MHCFIEIQMCEGNLNLNTAYYKLYYLRIGIENSVCVTVNKRIFIKSGRVLLDVKFQLSCLFIDSCSEGF